MNAVKMHIYLSPNLHTYGALFDRSRRQIVKKRIQDLFFSPTIDKVSSILRSGQTMIQHSY
jgi:hypothetical protein